MTPPITTVESAAILPGEYEFLSAIVANPCDEAVRLVYADWLDEQNDPRATFVRHLVKATQQLSTVTKLPGSKRFPASWLNMLGVPLIQAIVEHDLATLKEAILRVAKPIVTIHTTKAREDDFAVGDSKFGGHPDLPDGVAWPTSTAGPLGFLGQIALADIQRTQVAHELPRDGLLSFFAYQNWETGQQPGGFPVLANNTQVIYTPDRTTLRRQSPPADLGNTGNDIMPCCQLTFRETWDVPSYGDKVPADRRTAMRAIYAHEQGEKLHEIRSSCHSFGHHLLGYAVHFRTDDPSPEGDWTHLLCLDSDNNMGWSWCDGEHLAVYLPSEDLPKAAFTRVFGYAS